MRLLFCAMVLLGPVAGTSPQKIIYNIPEVTKSELEGHSFLRLVTPSGKIYHFRDDATLGKFFFYWNGFDDSIWLVRLVVEREEDRQDDWKTLPFITFGQPYGTNYYVQFPADQAGFKLFKGTNDFRTFLSYKKTLGYRNKQIWKRSRWRNTNDSNICWAQSETIFDGLLQLSTHSRK